MRIYVNGTTVNLSDGIPFDVEDFPGFEDGKVLHWDGMRWWYEADTATPTEVLAAMFAANPATLDELTDETLYRMAAYFQMWEPATAYAVGAIVQHAELPYRCVQAHTSQEGWEPPNAPALWVQIAKPGEIPEWVQPTGAHDAYAKGDHVTHDGKEWESEVDGNVWEPGVYGWAEVVKED